MSTPQSAKELLPLTFPPPQRFETARLVLRAIEAKDVKLAFDLYSSDSVATRYMAWKRCERIEESAAFVEPAAQFFAGQSSAVRDFVWIIELKSTKEPIGSVGIGPSSPFSLGGGYILAHKYWGKGYASEAWKCVVDWAKAQPGVYRIQATHALENPASGRVMVKSGMKFEGIRHRGGIYPNLSDKPQDEAIYAWARE